uniref:uncharacterized protein C10orf105-like n=1 Tax=Semicossyphus pulcher TaxID=241346 RepID=UPI0037E72507
MNATEPPSNVTWITGNVSLTSLTSSSIAPPSFSLPPSSSPHVSHPEFTIMVVLGLSLLLAGLAAFLAACRPSEQDGDSEESCGPGETWTRGRGGSTEPQLKVWKRLGSYRRSYNLSFRRPPPRRSHERESTPSASPGTRTPQPDAGVEPNISTPCLFDYVTEI